MSFWQGCRLNAMKQPIVQELRVASSSRPYEQLL